MQYVGKLMRGLDEATLDAVRAALDEQQRGSAQTTLALHQAEQWRDRLIADDDAIGEWLTLYPGTDSQQLRALARQARKDAQPDKTSISQGLAPRRAAPTARSSSWCASRWRPAMNEHDPVRIGIVSISDRASSGVYEDKGLPALQDWLTRALKQPHHVRARG
jgi:hypothetical protein